jgi:hypothetical protein
MATDAEGAPAAVRGPRAAAATLLAVVSLPAAAGAALDHPFPKRNQLPLNMLFLDQIPRSARLLDHGEARFSVTLGHENTLVADHMLHTLYAEDQFATLGGIVTEPILAGVAAGSEGGTSYFIDGETTRLALEAAVGFGRRLEFGAEIPLLMHSEGWMDGTIDRYHERFGLTDGGRSSFARYRFASGYVGDGEAVFVDGPPEGAGIGDIVLSARTALIEAVPGRRPALSAGAGLKLATGDAARLEGSGHSDYAIGLQLSHWFGRSTVHLGYARTFVGGWALAPGLPLEDPRSLSGSYVFAWTPRRMVIAQALRSSGAFPFRGGGDLGSTAMEMVAGMRHLLASGPAVEWGLVENLSNDQNTTDVGLFLGLTFFRNGPAPAHGRPSEGRGPASIH